MTVKELKEQLDHFPDNYIILVPNRDYHLDEKIYSDVVVATHASQGVNEFDTAVFIEHWEEDDD